MKVEVRPLSVEKWHGKKGQESFSRPQKFNPLVDSRNMKYASGLSPAEEEKYGKLLDQDLTSHYIPGKEHPFWDSPLMAIKLENATMFFDTNIPLDYIKIKAIKACKFVANSMKEYHEGLTPEATHVVFDESEEVEEKASRVALEQKAIVEQSQLTKTRKLQIILILSGKDLKNQSDDFVTVALSDLIKEDPAEVLRYIQQDKTQVLNHALVIECVQKGILRKDGHKMMYMSSVIGNDELDAAEYLMADENNELKVRLMKAVNEE
jgi:hypothetical protein